MGEIAVGLATERPTTKNELICANTEGPPINGVGIAALSQDLRRHVRHRACHAGKETTFRIMNSDVEVGDVRVTSFIKKNVVRLKITEGKGEDAIN